MLCNSSVKYKKVPERKVHKSKLFVIVINKKKSNEWCLEIVQRHIEPRAVQHATLRFLPTNHSSMCHTDPTWRITPLTPWRKSHRRYTNHTLQHLTWKCLELSVDALSIYFNYDCSIVTFHMSNMSKIRKTSKTSIHQHRLIPTCSHFNHVAWITDTVRGFSISFQRAEPH